MTLLSLQLFSILIPIQLSASGFQIFQPLFRKFLGPILGCIHTTEQRKYLNRDDKQV